MSDVPRLSGYLTSLPIQLSYFLRDATMIPIAEIEVGS